MSHLVTGEAVLLHLRPARLGSRLLARGIDLAIQFAVFWLASLVFGSIALGDSDIGFALIIVMVVALIVGYPVAFETLMRGRSPGKAALGLRVVRDDGGPIRFRHALTRGLLNLVDLWLTSATVGVITSLLSSRGKRVGDIVAGTFVIQERVPEQHVAPVFMPPQLAGWATSLDLSRLPDDLALAVRGFLGRAGGLRPEARERLGAELTAAVAGCVTPPPPAGTPGWAFLAAVVAERRRRDQLRLPAAAGGYAGYPGGLAGSGGPGGRRPGGPGALGGPGGPVGPGGPGALGGPGAGGPAQPGVPSPWQQGGPSPGWASAPERPAWSASAPPTGAPPHVGPPPAVGSPPADPGPPRLPSAPSPQWGPAPVPASPPPGAATPRRRAAGARRSPAADEPDERPPAPDNGFAAPG